MRATYLALTLLVAGGASAQELTKRVSFTTVAVPLTRAVDEIAKTTELKLRVTPLLAREVIFVSVTDVTTQELLDRVAQAASGTWVTESDGYRTLTQTPAQRQAEERAEIDERTRFFQKSIAELNEENKDDPNAPLETRERRAMRRAFGFGASEAGNNAMKRLMTLLNPVVLAGIREGERVVFSTNPTRMQVSLGANALPIVRQLIAEQNEIARQAEERKLGTNVEPERDPAMAQWTQRMEEMTGANFREKAIGEPAKALVIASAGGGPMFGMRFGGAQMLSCELQLFDADGKIIYRVTGTLGMDDMMAGFIALNQPAAEEEKGEPIEFSPVTKELNAIAMWANPMQSEIKLSKEAMEKLSRPDAHDPLSFRHSEALMAVAKAKGYDIVALLPDSIAGLADNLRTQPVTVGGFLAGLRRHRELKFEEKDGWLMISPARPGKARRERVDRAALAQFIAQARAKLLPSIEDLAAYAAVNDEPMSTPIVLSWFTAFAPNAMSNGMRGPIPWDGLRLWGRLSEPLRRQLVQGAQLSLASLPQGAAEVTRRMVFGANARIKVDAKQKRGEPQSWFDMWEQWMPQTPRDFRTEPTELLPNGLPPSGALRVEVKSEPLALMGEQGAGIRSFGALGPDEMAMFRYFQEDTRFAEMGAMMPRIDKVRLGNRQVITVILQLTSDASVSFELTDDRVDRNAAPIPVDQLPGEFKAQVDRRLEMFKKMPFPMFPGMGGSAARP